MLGGWKTFFHESSSWLQPWLLGKPFQRPVSNWLQPWQVEKPFWRRVLEMFGKHFWRRVLKLVSTLVSWKTFSMCGQAACNLGWLENLLNVESSSLLQPYLVGKPFRRRLFELVATSAGWKRFSTNLRAGCNLDWFENLFDEESSSWLQLWLVGKRFQRWVPALVATWAGWKAFSTTSPQSRASVNLSWLKNHFDKESSSWLQLSLVGKPFQPGVFKLVATLAGWKTFSMKSARACCNFGWLENLFNDESSIWLKNLFLELLATLAGWKTFPTTSPRSGCNHSWLENLFHDESSSWLQPWLVRKPFWWRILELLATLAGWKTFLTSPRAGWNVGGWKSCSSTIVQAGCKLGWLENFFNHGVLELIETIASWKTFSTTSLRAAATLAGWKIFSTTSPWDGRNLGVVETFLPMSPRYGCNLSWLENLFADGCSSWLQL